MALIYLFIVAILLLSLNSSSVPQKDVNYLRQVDPRKLEADDIGIESEVDNAILAAVAGTKINEQLTTTASLGTKEDEPLGLTTSISTSTSTSSTISTSTSESSSTNPTSTTAASTMPLRDLIHMRSLDVKQLILDQFSYNSPPNPRYHSSASSSHEIATTTKSISCDQDDAFKGIPIDDGKHHAWVPNPPGGYSREVLTKWENAFNEAMKRIREEASGGEKLREFAEMEVKQLRKMRHSLFCKRE